MLYRNQGADADNARHIIRSILKLQHNAPGKAMHGVWRTGPDIDREDENWGEFVGTGLIVARERFGALMDADLIQDIDAALVRAAEGAAKRNVLAHYTNIAVMSAFLLDYTGHIAGYYHAGLKNLCGPYARGYGMNMTEYVTLASLGIAMGLEDNAPLPNTRARDFEWAYAPLFAVLDVQPPADLLSEFKTFSGPREILDKVSIFGLIFQAQALLENDWMMGAATGMRRRWDQHFPGTVHWQAGKAGEAPGWLLVHGENAAEVRIIDHRMHVFLTQPNPGHPLRILIQVPGSATKGIRRNVWSLPGMKFEIQTPLPDPAIKIIKDKRLGKVIEVPFLVPASHPARTPALVLSPTKTD